MCVTTDRKWYRRADALTFAVTKFDDAFGGGTVALFAAPHLVQSVLIFGGALASVVVVIV